MYYIVLFHCIHIVPIRAICRILACKFAPIIFVVSWFIAVEGWNVMHMNASYDFEFVLRHGCDSHILYRSYAKLLLIKWQARDIKQVANNGLHHIHQRGMVPITDITFVDVGKYQTVFCMCIALMCKERLQNYVQVWSFPYFYFVCVSVDFTFSVVLGQWYTGEKHIRLWVTVSDAIITQSYLSYITYSTAITVAESESDFRLTTGTPYPALTDELCGLFARMLEKTGPRLNIKTVLSTYGDFHVKDKTAVRTSYL